MIAVDIEVDAKKAIARMANMSRRSENFIPVFIWARQQLEQANAQNFAANGLPSGKAWAPLDPQYGAWKATRFPGAPTMVRTGNLFRSLTNLRGAPSFIRREEAQFGTNVEYAKFHQSGTFKMPKRQIVFEPPLFAKRLAKNMGSYIVDGRF